MWIKNSSRINLVVIRERTSTSVPSCSWREAHVFDFWLDLVQSCELNAHLWLECAGCSSGTWFLPFFVRKGPGSHIPRLFHNVIQSNLSADGWDNLLWKLILIWGTTLMFSQPLYIVLLLLSYRTLQNFCYKRGWIIEILTEGITLKH